MTIEALRENVILWKEEKNLILQTTVLQKSHEKQWEEEKAPSLLRVPPATSQSGTKGMGANSSSLQGREQVWSSESPDIGKQCWTRGQRKCSGTIFRVCQRTALGHKRIEEESKRILGNASMAVTSLVETLSGEVLIRFRIPCKLLLSVTCKQWLDHLGTQRLRLQNQVCVT